MFAIVTVALPVFQLPGGKNAPVPRHFLHPPVTLEPGTALTIETVDDVYARVQIGDAHFAVVATALARSVAVGGR